MITLEVATERSLETLPKIQSLGIELDRTKKSDRMPSLWQKIITNSQGDLIHIFDRKFAETDGPRWLYESIHDNEWKRFRFKKRAEKEFIELIQQCLSVAKSLWLLSDAQFGPPPLIYRSHTFRQFLSLYRSHGIRLNSALPITE
jgi:hypothetical protein